MAGGTALPSSTNPRLSSNAWSHQSVVSSQTVDLQMTSESGTAVEIHDVKDDEVAIFTQDVLGWSQRRKGTNLIERHLPAQHADYRQLWATSISGAEGLAPTGSREGSVSGDSVPAFKTRRVRLTYSTPNYDVLDDQEIESEWQRYLVLEDCEPITEFFRRNAGAFRYADPTVGGVIPGSSGAAQLIQKQRYTYLWMQVPDEGLYTAGGFAQGGRAKRIEELLGKVNSEIFMGWPKGTILFEAWKAIPRMSLGDPLFGNRLPRSWNVRLQFVYFDPPTPNGPNSNDPRGHNLYPHQKKSTWHRAILDHEDATDASAWWRYQEADLRDIFLLNDPS